jgi:predicted nucleic acid-binding protein
MSGDRYFLDTNILVYANDESDPAKRSSASRLIVDGLRSGRAVISSQVLGEFWVTVTMKIKVPLLLETAEAEIERFRSLHVVSIDADLVLFALEKHKRFRISYWDALILASAEISGCETVYSEDLGTGQVYGNVRVVNPF